MVNMTQAKVEPTQVEVATAQAAMRPLAGFGAGASACEGAFVGWDGVELRTVQSGTVQSGTVELGTVQSASAQSAAGQLAVGHAVPRIRRVFRPEAHAGFAGTASGNAGSGVAGSGTATGSTKQLNQTTRIYPVTPGGVGPHPAREPDPV
jgi:hypothetical protein